MFYHNSTWFTSEDSGSADAPIHYRAVNPGKVRFSGGRELPAESFVPITDAASGRYADDHG